MGFAVKELCRDVKNPLGRSWRKLKRCLRYLAGSRDLGIFMKKSDRASAKRPKLEVFVDSDWAGVTDDGQDLRKSTSGYLAFVNGSLVHFYSRTQKQTAMSSCEAEFISVATGVSETVYLKRVVDFLWGEEPEVEIYCDSSSARQLAKKKGVGNIRHLDLKLLFAQRMLEEKLFVLKPIAGVSNPSDLLTKAVDRQTLEKYFEVLGLKSLPNSVPSSSVAVVAKTFKGNTWSAIVRVFCVLGTLPAATAEKTEQEEHDLNMLVLMSLLVMLILALVAGCWLGRCCAMMTLKKNEARPRHRNHDRSGHRGHRAAAAACSRRAQAPWADVVLDDTTRREDPP